MRELWAKRLALITGVAVVVLAIVFALSQNPEKPPSSSAGTNVNTADYVGSAVCGKCHSKKFEAWSRSGHAFMLNAVKDGQPPNYPFTSVPHPPQGYKWKDISYVIGGYQWKARFTDQRGYIITGDKVQYNFANPVLNKQTEWVAYSADKTDKPFNCGACHTTGFQSEARQAGMPGLHGNWAEAGIGCENCHGPGRDHAASPTKKIETDRSSEVCGRCHIREPLDEIEMSKGFIRHHQQYNSQRQSKHASLSCNDCHDPHAGVIAPRVAGQPTVHKTCLTCHQGIEQKTSVHSNLVCIDCHMPRLDASAWKNPAEYSGDLRTHLFAIDPQATSQAMQKNDKTVSISAITLDFACRNCHRPEGAAADLSTERLREFATGIHKGL